MFTVAVFNKQTHKIILLLPLQFDRDVRISSLPAILHNDFDFRVFSDIEAVMYEDSDGDICLKENCFIVDSNWLMGNEQ